ncbi:hypothetical protein CHS0354_022514 [Potamilus streckersoni]|uniref:Alcohol dehydrogenase-like C-terminal domain-containing protein n=1 Tax=Potamilus streckersoni TaxID=2493646 RepID=A0AAE0S6Z5_9BIVA|nr:hypothetical protein CHS0354_022514 [Potamilus streckersoni]
MTVTDFENKLDNFYLGGNTKENKVEVLPPSRNPVVTMDTCEESEKHVILVYSALLAAKRYIEKNERKSNVTMLIVGANQSGIIAAEYAPKMLAYLTGQVNVFIADSSIERLMAAEEVCSDVICWSADEHEQSLVEKTKSACKGGADLILDFIGTPRTIQRAMKILNKGGAFLIGPDALSKVSINLCSLIAQQQSIIGVVETSEAVSLYDSLLHHLVTSSMQSLTLKD